MFEKLFGYLEKRPRAVVAAALTFILALSGISGLCFYVLTIVVESERATAMRELTQAREIYEGQAELLTARAKLNSDQIIRLVDSTVPLLRSQADDVRKLSEEFAQRQKDKSAPMLYAKLSQVEYQLRDLETRLTAARIMGPPISVEASVSGDTWLRSYLLRWLMRWSIVVAAVSLLFLVFVLKKKNRA